MRYYPIQLDLQGRRCLVVGGGAVGTRKAGTLHACGAEVVVVSPEATAELAAWAAAGRVQWRRRAYESSDLDGVFLAVGATDDELLNRRLSAEARRRGVLCNIADRPELCDFILPALVQRGDLVITVSTSGKSPALAKRLRRELGQRYGEEYAVLLRLMGAVRRRLLAQAHAPEEHRGRFEALLDGGLLERLREGDLAGADRVLSAVLGPEWKAEELLAEAD
ncbi:MAG: bifunctional precorrin-2 dehydrogenase/sirohydrochlorin ferrochelatase [Desulfobacterales bacterium]